MDRVFTEAKLRKAIDYWLRSAEHDLDTAELLYGNKKYTWTLFLGHLVLEKTFKALWVKVNKDIVVPRIHNLLKLAELCGIKLNKGGREELIRITGFNIETRYPEEQAELYKKCTRAYASKYFGLIKSWRKRVLEQLKQL